LRVSYPKGFQDLAILKKTNPIPLGRDEREEDVDNCIYDGFMKNEKSAYFTLTGCANSDNFEVNLLKLQELVKFWLNLDQLKVNAEGSKPSGFGFKYDSVV
jgi:hypothetical protein